MSGLDGLKFGVNLGFPAWITIGVILESYRNREAEVSYGDKVEIKR